MKNKIITAFLIVVLGANLVGNFYQYSRMENATKEVAILTEQRDSLKERGEIKEQQRNELFSGLSDAKNRLADLQARLSELETEKEAKEKILVQKQAEDTADEETQEETEKQEEKQTKKQPDNTSSGTSSKPTGKTETSNPPEQPEDWTDGDSDASYPTWDDINAEFSGDLSGVPNYGGDAPASWNDHTGDGGIIFGY